MAYRKVDESSLTQVANAIRNKAGTSARLNFPTGFANAIAAIPTGSGGITPTGTITITENGTHYVANYENAHVALPEVVQATPSISVNSSGLITASVTQEAGVVPAGTETATKQLSTQGAKTVTPGTSNQTAVSSGRYTTGTVTVKGDANLVAGNIKKGVSIFNVTGTYEGSGGSIDDFFPTGPFSYTVDAISGASYGFALNEAGYYESQNKAFPSTYAICRVNFNVKQTSDIVFDIINFAEAGYDYGLLGNLDVSLGLNIGADSNVKKNFQNSVDHSASVVHVTYAGVTPGRHFVDVKFIKDNSTNRENDSIQFKIQSAGASLPQETIDHILQADTDLVPENIKAGVDIFGVIGTLAGGGLPSGVSTLASGTYTPTQDISSGVDISHGLGVTPNFFIWWVEEDVSLNSTAYLLTQGALIKKTAQYNTGSSTIYTLSYMLTGYNSTPQYGGTTNRVSNNTYMTNNTCRMHSSSTYKLLTGHTYRWVAGVADGVL